MLRAFTRNYQDNSTEAGFQFTFYCDHCQDGYKSDFVESETYRKNSGLRSLSQGVSILGALVGGRAGQLGNAAQRGGNILSERFEGKSPEWQKEHEIAFEHAQIEGQQRFRRCPSCHNYVCDHCWNENEGLCVRCTPRQEIYVARARADAMKRNIDTASQSATVWQGEIESKTTICPRCGKSAGNGKFCNHCGSDLSLVKCSACGAENAQGLRFCSNCGSPLNAATTVSAAASAVIVCPSCGRELNPNAKFCGGCGARME